MAADNGLGNAQQMELSHGRPFSRPEEIPGLSQSRLPARRSRTSESGGSLTMLSPKTPSQISTCYPELFSTLNSAAAEREPGLGAFDSYGMGYTGNYEGLTSQNSHNFDIDSSRNTLIGHDGNNSGHSISHTSPRETTQHSKSSGAKANVHGNFNSNTFS